MAAVAAAEPLVLARRDPKEDAYIAQRLGGLPPSRRELRIGSDPTLITLVFNEASGAVRGLLYDAHRRFGAPSKKYELLRSGGSRDFGSASPTTPERVQLIKAVIERTRALGVEISCDLSAHEELLQRRVAAQAAGGVLAVVRSTLLIFCSTRRCHGIPTRRPAFLGT